VHNSSFVLSFFSSSTRGVSSNFPFRDNALLHLNQNLERVNNFIVLCGFGRFYKSFSLILGDTSSKIFGFGDSSSKLLCFWFFGPALSIYLIISIGTSFCLYDIFNIFSAHKILS